MKIRIAIFIGLALALGALSYWSASADNGINSTQKEGWRPPMLLPADLDSFPKYAHVTYQVKAPNVVMRADDGNCPSTPEYKAFYANLNAALPLKTEMYSPRILMELGAIPVLAEQKTERPVKPIPTPRPGGSPAEHPVKVAQSAGQRKETRILPCPPYCGEQGVAMLTE